MLGEIEIQLGDGFAALDAGHWTTARECFEAALATGEVPEAMLGLARALFWLGDMPGTITFYERAYAAFMRRPDPMYAAASALALVVHNKQHLGNRAAAAGWLARATTLIEDDSIDALRAGLLVMRAYETEQPQQREDWGRQALEIARRTGDLDWELGAMSVVGKALCEQGRIVDGTALLDEAMAGALAGQSALDAVVFTVCQTMTACAGSAEFERAAQWVRASDRFAERYGCPFLYIECRVIYGRVLFETGEWARAAAELERAIAMSKGSAEAYTVQATATAAELRLAQGRLEEAERMLAPWEGRPETIAVTARTLLARGHHARAIATLNHRLDTIGPAQIESATLLELLGEAEVLAGDAQKAIARGTALAELGNALQCSVIAARGERLCGLALGSTGAPRARRHLAVAISEFIRLGMPYEVARTRMMTAEISVEDDAELAASEAGAALSTFEDLGAMRDADAAAALLRSHGWGTRGPGPRALGTLTKRERQVLDLIGEGLSNPDIATRLFLSRRTVEHHVASILSKLGLRTRAEAAAIERRAALGNR